MKNRRKTEEITKRNAASSPSHLGDVRPDGPEMPFKPNDPKKKKAARGYRDYGDNLHKSEGVIAAFFIFVE
ncbi:unnamed protein product [Ceratitis capitata]|uniref:(Mediterranean fruit fly) hypothetical protein n=1 Tax=Ceratitis capitata TaxID=7213 RepID=A0A811UQH1_CERCA|nr:unnamed protein product [Ceratitis capitata]